MTWRVMVEVMGEDGPVTPHAISEGERTGAGPAATLGLSLCEGKATLAGLQRVLVTAQADAHCRLRRRCGHCGASHRLKDHRSRRLVSLFGTVEVRTPLRRLPLRRGLPAQPDPGRQDHVRPLHPGVRTRPGRHEQRAALPAGADIAGQVAA